MDVNFIYDDFKAVSEMEQLFFIIKHLFGNTVLEWYLGTLIQLLIANINGNKLSSKSFSP